VLLVATGCKIQVPGAAPGSASTAGTGQAGTTGRAGTTSVTRAGSLIVEPGAGFSPVHSLINGARHSVDVTMSDTTAERDLGAAAGRGVRARRAGDPGPPGDERELGRVHLPPLPPGLGDLVVDDATAVIMTANLTSRYYATSRDFLVVDTERADVSAITAAFDADFARKAVHPCDGNDLVWSPTDSQDQLIALINATAGTGPRRRLPS
jgi:phosphatidylserine/phosphatidylglycerophosphate/cardiolipin synthase-like enzyme